MLDEAFKARGKCQQCEGIMIGITILKHYYVYNILLQETVATSDEKEKLSLVNGNDCPLENAPVSI